jgi:predicted DNA-binding transcriptional regulator AlpA
MKLGGYKMLRVKDVMQKYSVSKPTVYSWFKRGLKYIKVGKITFIEEEELIKFIKGE